jgi:hypothetical protein
VPGRSERINDPAVWEALANMLGEIESHARAVAAGLGVDLRVEWSEAGKFPCLIFRPRGFLPFQGDD